MGGAASRNPPELLAHQDARILQADVQGTRPSCLQLVKLTTFECQRSCSTAMQQRIASSSSARVAADFIRPRPAARLPGLDLSHSLPKKLPWSAGGRKRASLQRKSAFGDSQSWTCAAAGLKAACCVWHRKQQTAHRPPAGQVGVPALALKSWEWDTSRFTLVSTLLSPLLPSIAAAGTLLSVVELRRVLLLVLLLSQDAGQYHLDLTA